jgi:hypothetical protein
MEMLVKDDFMIEFSMWNSIRTARVFTRDRDIAGRGYDESEICKLIGPEIDEILGVVEGAIRAGKLKDALKRVTEIDKERSKLMAFIEKSRPEK